MQGTRKGNAVALRIAKTKYGTVKGIPSANPAYTTFLGVPFAKPPVGNLRFHHPQEPELWEGELLCDHFTLPCIQGIWIGERIEMSEDCLYLNIFTPAETPEERLPVMFWIHGGGFTGGRADDAGYKSETCNRLGAILVTVNYRCNVMGFFNLPEFEKMEGVGGNLGLLDQIAALKWVKENISAFGGDPDRVMIYGQSAGGVSTRMLLTSPLTKGLFSRAVAESGGGLNEADPVRSKEEFTRMCQRCVDYLGWTVEDVMTRNAEEVNDALNEAAQKVMDGWEVGYFQPYVDAYSLKDVPGKSIWAGEYWDIPIMCGTVAGDSWMFTRKVREELGDRINCFRGFSYAAGVAWARHQIHTGRSPIYSFFMDRTQPQTHQETLYRHGAPVYGARTPHCSEIAYIFGSLDLMGKPYPEYDYALSDVMSRYWVNFAKTGNPNGDGLEKWPLYTKDTPYVMHFGNDGYGAEDIILSDDEKRAVDYTESHPGMLESLEGFFDSR